MSSGALRIRGISRACMLPSPSGRGSVCPAPLSLQGERARVRVLRGRGNGVPGVRTSLVGPCLLPSPSGRGAGGEGWRGVGCFPAPARQWRGVLGPLSLQGERARVRVLRGRGNGVPGVRTSLVGPCLLPSPSGRGAGGEGWRGVGCFPAPASQWRAARFRANVGPMREKVYPGFAAGRSLAKPQLKDLKDAKRGVGFTRKMRDQECRNHWGWHP